MSDDSPNMHTAADPLLDDLTPPQREAATHVDGPLLVLAGAGSGKTRVITRRIAHLVLRVGIAPWNILAITFTNKAAGEMRARVGQLVSERQANAVTVCTFHSLCARLVRHYADRLDLSRTYSIYDTSDQTRVMKQALKAMGMSTSNFPPGKVLSTISNAKNELLDPSAYAVAADDFYSRTVAEIYKKYQKTLTKNNALDFDDLLLHTVTLFKKHPDALDELRQKYQYLLIDEYQDTNHAQFSIAHALSAQHQNICATGDPDQSIYGWRGADIRNILEFEEHYPGVTTVRLEQNYRSTKNILAVADGLIQQNTQRKHKRLWTENKLGQPVRSVACRDERHEAQWVIDWFTELRDRDGLSWSGMAVFYRVNSLSRVMEEALINAHIPYQIARGTAFYDRKEIKDAIAYLRVISNPADEVNLLRIINTPSRGISENTVRALSAHAVASHINLYQAMNDPDRVASLNPRAVVSVQKFAKQLEAWRAEAGLATAPSVPVGELATQAPPTSPSLRGFVERVLRESGLEQYYKNDKSDPDHERLMNLGELVSSAQQFEDEFDPVPDQGQETLTLADKLAAYLEQVSLVSDVDAVDPDQGSVTLMTLHAAKGLEFPIVAMIGFEDGLLPHSISQSESREIEEERRLCFVGITRAQEQLAMTHTRHRTIFGQLQSTIPSRFLDELPAENMQQEDLSDQAGGLTGGRHMVWLSQESDATADQQDGEFPPGALVRHPQFGLGRVIEIRAGGAQSRARIEFNTAGVKTLILQYARLERVSV